MLFIPQNINQAKEYQQQIKKKVWFDDNFDFRGVHTVAGIDASYVLKENKIIIGIVLYDYPSFNLFDKLHWITEITFPYIPGYLSFREGIPIVEALQKLNVDADMIIIDGHGIAHPKRLGLATFVGCLTNTPTIGIAKKVLVGKYPEPDVKKGSYSLLTHRDELIGMVLRTRKNVKPVFVSPGFIINMQDSFDFVVSLPGKYRLPEPTRQAHNLVTEIRKNWIPDVLL